MLIKNLAIEEGSSYEVVPNPQWDPIAKAIQSLDGKERTMVSLEGGEKTHMAIGGGPDVCVVFATADNETFHRAIDPEKAGSDVEVVVGQQKHQYPAEFLIGKEMAIKAAKTFAELGALEESLHWLTTDAE